MMITSLKQPTISLTNHHILRQKSQIPTSQFTPFSPLISRKCNVLINKPLHMTPFTAKNPCFDAKDSCFNAKDSCFNAKGSCFNAKGSCFNGGVLRGRKSVQKCEAYEADQPVEDDVIVVEGEGGRKVKIGVYFATWWALNVVFNIYNKKVLNAYPYPWLTSTLSLAMGSLIMLVSWGARIAEAPDTDFEFWKALLPVAVAHTIGHVAATVSMSKVAVSFTHIIKSAEPAFSVLVSRFLLGESFPPGVYLSLIPIIGGCGLAAVTELNFNMIGFLGAMISNLAFVFRNIFSKKGMTAKSVGKSVSGMNYYACLSILSLVLLTPFAIAVEGPQMWAAGWEKAVSQIGPNFIWWVVAQSVFYHLYNQVSYMSLDEISPLTFSIGNTMKRISVIVSSIIIFRTPVQPVNALGAAIAVLGTFLYSQVSDYDLGEVTLVSGNIIVNCDGFVVKCLSDCNDFPDDVDSKLV